WLVRIIMQDAECGAHSGLGGLCPGLAGHKRVSLGFLDLLVLNGAGSVGALGAAGQQQANGQYGNFAKMHVLKLSDSGLWARQRHRWPWAHREDFGYLELRMNLASTPMAPPRMIRPMMTHTIGLTELPRSCSGALESCAAGLWLASGEAVTIVGASRVKLILFSIGCPSEETTR